MMRQVPAFTESSYARLESTTGAQERVSYSETVGYSSLNRKDKMELVAKDHAQQGPHKILQVRERYHRNSSPPMAQAYGSLRNDVMWPERVTGMVKVLGP